MNVREAEELFLRELPLIDRIIAAACRRGGIDRADADDVAGALRLKLIEDDYRAVRGYEGKSSFATWVAVIVQRFLVDFRNQRWGRWTPSAEAVRLGDCAVRLEMMLHRDGRTFEEACGVLLADEKLGATRETLEALHAKLPRRLPRATTQSLEESGAAEVLRGSDSPEEKFFERERGRLGAEASQAIDATVARLEPEDRLLFRMRFADGMSVATIARATGEDQRRLYYRLDRIALALRRALESAGVDARSARELLVDGAASLNLVSLGIPRDETSKREGAIGRGGVPSE